MCLTIDCDISVLKIDHYNPFLVQTGTLCWVYDIHTGLSFYRVLVGDIQMELMLKASNWENKVKKEEGKYLIVLMFATVEKMFPVEIYSLIWVCRDQRWLIQLVDPSAVAAQIYVNQGIFSISLIYVVKSYYILNYKHMGVLWTIKNALSFILKLNCWLYFYFWACFVYMQKSSIFMNAFNFLLVLMTVKRH